jgi:hypothetical protein
MPFIWLLCCGNDSSVKLLHVVADEQRTVQEVIRQRVGLTPTSLATAHSMNINISRADQRDSCVEQCVHALSCRVHRRTRCKSRSDSCLHVHDEAHSATICVCARLTQHTLQRFRLRSCAKSNDSACVRARDEAHVATISRANVARKKNGGPKPAVESWPLSQ